MDQVPVFLQSFNALTPESPSVNPSTTISKVGTYSRRIASFETAKKIK